ncbi:uncharacterized protein LOC110028288 [Phalaenopsis equestris]|uniref:uncharacterized protein LOC110028288 n=1 Tax=Phalaenopsis equestris TaxID=78828 RepID=UPI0009E25945|nr:uncharacterized protein LOC110028288 [Phalaenopsis equestris]XP_020585734.1 uncharacterized protein LOC110028288 [Phalaenopsis equestris]
MAQKFLLYIMTNHDVSTNRVTVLQALKISLCWRAASMSGHSLDRCGSLSVAKKQLKFECTDQEAYSVYSKLQILEEKFPCQTGALETLSVENIPDNQSPSKIVNDVREASDWRDMDTEANGNLTAGVADEFHFGDKASKQLISLQGHPIGESLPDFGSYNENPFKNQIDVIDEVFLKRSKDLTQRQLAELCNFHKQMNKNKLKLEETHELDLKLIRSIHIDERIRKDKINILRQEFSNKLGRFDQHRKQQKQKLLSMQLDMLKKEELKSKTGVMDESVDAIPRSESGFRLENFLETSELTTNYRKTGATIFDFTCPSDGTIIGYEGCLEVPSNILNEQEENDRPGDDTLASCTLATGDDLEQIVQNRLSAATANCPGLSDVLPMNSGISAPQSEVFKPFSRLERFNFNQQECWADSNVQLVPDPEPKQTVLLSPVQGLTSYVPASTLSSTQGLCTNKHTRPAEALTNDNNHDTDSAQEVTVTASDSVVNLSPHIEMMTCNDVARSYSTNIPLPQAEHEQERLPPTGNQEATPQPHHSVELSEIPAQQETMNLAIESDPSNSQIPENAIQPLRPQEYLPSEGIASEHLGNTVIQYGRACDWSHSSTQQAEVMVQAAVSEGEPSIQQIPDPMRAHEDLQFERTHLEHLRSTDIQRDEPSQFFQNFSSVPRQAIHTDPIRNELIRVQTQDISCTKQHEKKKLLLQSRCEEEMEKVRRKYNMLLQDAEKEYLQEKNILLKIIQKICWHKAFAEDVSSNFYDHQKGSSTSFQAPSQNSSQHPQASAPVPLSTTFQPHAYQNTNLASTPHFLPISRPQASSTGLVNPRGILQTGPINLRPNLHAGRSPAPHLQRGRAPHASDSTFSTPLASVATMQPTPPSLVSTATPAVPPPNLASSFPAPFPFMDSNILNTFGTLQPARFGTSPHYFGIPQSELPHYAGPDDGLLESLLANFPAAEAHAETVIDSRPITSPDFIYFTDDD